MAKYQRDLKREQVWRRHVERQRSRRLTVRAYCFNHGLHESAFYFWRRVIAERDRETAATTTTPAAAAVPSAAAFVPVAVIEGPTRRCAVPIDIRLVDGRCVRVRAGCDRQLLADVLAILEGRSGPEGRSIPEGRPC
jgi:hypothetical protein